MVSRVAVVIGLAVWLVLPLGAGEAPVAPTGEAPEMLQELKAYKHKIVFETNRDGNWELYVMNADGSNPVNITKTPDVDEMYAKASPDGPQICFTADEKKDGKKARNLFLMNTDGTNRTKICDNAREPCWSADGKCIAFLKGEYERYDAMDYVTKGIFIYDLKTAQTREHPNKKIAHLYCLNWSPDGNWFVATVHAGASLGFKHAILALGADNDKVFDLNLGGCRPDLSPDGKKIIWGHGDNAVGLADLELTADTAKAKTLYNVVQSKKPMETYHADWSPDGKYIAFSRGPEHEGKRVGLAPEIPSSNAPGWNICVADASQKTRWVAITTDGKSNKEPDWIFVKGESGK